MDKVISDIKKTLYSNLLTDPNETKNEGPTDQDGNNQLSREPQSIKSKIINIAKRNKIILLSLLLVLIVLGTIAYFFSIWPGRVTVSLGDTIVNNSTKRISIKQHNADSIGILDKNQRMKIDNSKSIKPKMIFVRGGEFMMGDDNSGYDSEEPVHKVVVTDFYIGKYEVTQKQWTAIMGNNPSYSKGCDNCPVDSVSWDDVQEFLKKLNQKTGKTYRLPTEAEWEYAAGGGSNNRTKWAGTNNEDEFDDYAWYDKNSGGKTHPVGTKKPNSLGIYDMSGNVWEWCGDRYSSTYYEECESKGLIKNPTGPKSDPARVLRGGTCGSHASGCRVANRYYSTPDYECYRLGFRILLAM